MWTMPAESESPVGYLNTLVWLVVRHGRDALLELVDDARFELWERDGFCASRDRPVPSASLLAALILAASRGMNSLEAAKHIRSPRDPLQKWHNSLRSQVYRSLTETPRTFQKKWTDSLVATFALSTDELAMLNTAYHEERDFLFDAKYVADALDSPITRHEAFKRSAQPLDRMLLPHRLPILVGRARELDVMHETVRRQAVVNLSGPPGVGKSALLNEFGWQNGVDFRDGCLWIPFDELRTPALFWEFLLSEMAIAPSNERNAKAVAIDRLRSQDLLLLLDNCEHVLDDVRDFLHIVARRCPGVAVVMTSQERLYDSELGSDMRIDGLESPPESEQLEVPDLTASAAQLFFEFVRRHRPVVELGRAEAEAVAEICRRLDGLPLALELVAPHTALLSLEDIASGLRERLEPLTGTGSLHRHDSLTAAITWSYELLEPDLQRVWLTIGTFVNGCTIDALAEVTESEREHLSRAVHVLERKSLVRLSHPMGTPRIGLLESLAAFAKAQLMKDPTLDAVHVRHAAYYRRWAELNEPALREGAEQLATLAVADLEHENLLAAIQRSSLRGDGDVALAIVGALWRYWKFRGHLREALDLAGILIRKFPEWTLSRCRALCSAGNLAYWRREYELAIEYLDEAYDIACAVDDRRWGVPFSRLISAITMSAMDDPDLTEVQRRLEESLEGWDRLGDRTGRFLSEYWLGRCARLVGDMRKAERLEAECRGTLTLHDDLWATAQCGWGLGVCAEADGKLGEAEALYRSTLPIWPQLRDSEGSAACLVALARLTWKNRPAEAIPFLREALSLECELQVIDRSAEALELVARIADVNGFDEAVIMLAGASFRCRAHLNNASTVTQQESLKAELMAFARVGGKAISLIRTGENLVELGSSGELDSAAALRYAAGILDEIDRRAQR